MNDKTKFPKEFETLLRIMFSFVGANYDTFEFKEQWYWEYEWTEAQEAKFKEIFMLLLKTDKQMRKVIIGHGYVVKNDVLEKAFTMFNLQWGWKTKKESED
jgi:hypothetical protein